MLTLDAERLAKEIRAGLNLKVNPDYSREFRTSHFDAAIYVVLGEIPWPNASPEWVK